MDEIQKHNQSGDKKVWSTPDLELIDIQSGTVPGSAEGAFTIISAIEKYNVS